MAGGAVLTLLSSFTAWGQEPAKTGTAVGPYPALPGATTKPPGRIGTVALFDVVKFFAAPPRDRNAAPCTWTRSSNSTAGWIPASPQGPSGIIAARTPRVACGDTWRWRTHSPATRRLSSPRGSTEAIAPYDAGFRRLAEAQRRERCVFETDIGPCLHPRISGGSPGHPGRSMAGRAVPWNGETSMGRSATSRRCSAWPATFSPAAQAEAQMLATAMVQVVGADMLPTILSSTKIKAAHCDRLLRAFSGRSRGRATAMPRVSAPST